MKFSEQWLREWVNPPVATAELVAQLTMAGLEVDGVEPAGPGLQDLVVGEVLSVAAHPDADKLRVCRVAAGAGEPLQIVCGAPNVSAGGRYPLAPVGATLPGGISIRKSRLRGVESHGMLCSARELGLSEEHAGLMELPAEAVAGQPLAALLGLDDTLIEVDLTPNRGDCLGIEGIAREVGTLTRSPVTPVLTDVVPETIPDRFPIEVLAPAACPRYLGRVVRDVNATAETPLWMQERLRRSGLRSLGPVVDVTNYVMLELGQPMHAFDMTQLSGGIRVRYAEPGETLTLLDERTIGLDDDTLVIADHARVLAIAGVMGGIDSGVQAQTSDLFLECAFFTPEAIAGCARRYAMHTESAHRFERGVDPDLPLRAMERATRLLLEISGGEPGPVVEVSDAGHLPGGASIVLRRARLERLLGMAPEPGEVTDILTRLGMTVTAEGEDWRVRSPSFRFDIELEADLIEEVGRIHGYNRLPSVAMHGALEVQPEPENRLTMAEVCDILVARGYQEAVTYSFVDPALQARVNPQLQPVALANPISSEMSEMRTSLWPGLIRAVQYNLNRQKTRLRLFEHGLKFYREVDEIKQESMISGIVTGGRLPEHWSLGTEAVDFYDVKHDVETLLRHAACRQAPRYVAAGHPALHPGQSAQVSLGEEPLGWLGRIHPALAAACDLDEDTFLFELRYAAIREGAPVRFRPISRYPSIRRDLAVVVDADVAAAQLARAVQAAAGTLLQELVFFDVYQGKGVETGRKSIAFGLILQDYSRTLTDQDIESVVAGVTARLSEEFGATLRT